MMMTTPWPRLTGGGGCGGGCEIRGTLVRATKKRKGKRPAEREEEVEQDKRKASGKQGKEGKARADHSMDPRGESRSNRS